ncbi:pyridoxamine 5'-phosphate oxidase-related FMN-binding [Shewanella halifaxensis HAW-EB4]|uniref:Pyridoxamine 5'-phosphate oxidase-related FMN-binding n=1 Tax=Shewanella halifaxensis (strain HAW-EB4) TaxID=458817 RepID=B0TSI9_SHEHH|nr:heme utilization protein HutZ [Shewanella halifaxensis]ABZ77943.1 pyridoxamine 5'-phosphate oxidase-related FMN-binding [Shewanella halifaxensis HAW-EB4]
MNTEKEQRLRDKLLPEIEAFKAERSTLQLATQDADGLPNASYAPFALADDGFYILVSELARHGSNLKASKNLSVMLLEDEAEAKTVFARKRLTFDATAELVDRESDNFSKGIAALSARFGEMIDNLAGLGDFNLFKLNPHQGLYVKGFGQAFSLSGVELLDVDWKRDGHHGTPRAELADTVI